METPSKNLRIVAVCLRCLWLVPASLIVLLVLFGRVSALFSGYLFLQALFGLVMAAAALGFCAWVWKRTAAMGRGEVPLTPRGVAGRAVGMLLLLLVLLAILVPKYMDLMRYVGEGTNKGNLGAVRDAIHRYQGDHDGLCPPELAGLTRKGGYLGKMPSLWLKRVRGIPHRKTAEVAAMKEKVVRDTGGWGYVFDPSEPKQCEVFIDCSHTDSRGEAWSSY